MASQNSLIVKLCYSSSSASAINRTQQATISNAPRAATSASSSQQFTPAKITSHFSQSQLALALAIQKAKPEVISTHGKSEMPCCHFAWLNMSIEYCQQLRKCIKTGQPISIDGLRYVDTCEFWKEQYSKIYLENKALQNTVQKLEHAGLKLHETPHDQNNHKMLQSLGDPLIPELGEVGCTYTESSWKRPAPIEENRVGYHEQDRTGHSFPEDNCMRMNNYGTQEPCPSIPCI
jgi:hypothetical protein